MSKKTSRLVFGSTAAPKILYEPAERKQSSNNTDKNESESSSGSSSGKFSTHDQTNDEFTIMPSSSNGTYGFTTTPNDAKKGEDVENDGHNSNKYSTFQTNGGVSVMPSSSNGILCFTTTSDAEKKVDNVENNSSSKLSIVQTNEQVGIMPSISFGTLGFITTSDDGKKVDNVENNSSKSTTFQTNKEAGTMPSSNGMLDEENVDNMENDSSKSLTFQMDEEVGIIPSFFNGMFDLITTSDDDAENVDDTESSSSKISSWSPLSDGIIATFSISVPNSGTEKFDERTKKRIDEYINNILYGKGRNCRRLPVFEEICPSSCLNLINEKIDEDTDRY